MSSTAVRSRAARLLATITVGPMLIFAAPTSALAQEDPPSNTTSSSPESVAAVVQPPDLLVLDVLEAPDDAVLESPVPDPGAPQPAPEVSVETAVDDYELTGGTNLNCKSYGTARWQAPSDNTCPPLHWYGGRFYVKDRTGTAWPVHDRTDYWNLVPDLTVGYGCPSTYHCVTVVEGSYGATKWIGLTTYTSDSLHRFTSMTIKLNNSYRITAAQRAQAICHELGHAAGLGHESADNSCMWYQADGLHGSGNSYDFHQLSDNTY